MEFFDKFNKDNLMATAKKAADKAVDVSQKTAVP